jgi:hypothetical protein
MISSIFWDVALRNPVKAKRSFGGIYRYHFQAAMRFLLASSINHAAFMLAGPEKMKAVCYTESSVDFHRTLYPRR